MKKIQTIIFENGLFAVFFLGLFFVFLWPLLDGKSGFVVGDYGAQLYPWAWAYAEALKKGALLLWTPLIQCGFPLFAEGQTGMLYLLNLFLFRFFPFTAAYNGMFLLHFLMGGFFAYCFALKKGMSREGSVLAALAFTFGSAYAGCFFNIVTMRSLVWFPLALYLIEKFLEKRKLLPLFFLALVQAQSWLAGSPQPAAYVCFFTVVYYLLRVGETGPALRNKVKISGYFFAALFLSVIIALPQLWATGELAGESTRVLYEKEFALWGSVPPWCLVTLFLYPWDAFLRHKIYIGVAPFLALCLGGFDKRFRIWWILAGLSLFLALGAFNPFYWLLLNLPVVSLLRNPSKFLFFTVFFLSILAGFSLDTLRERFLFGSWEETARLMRRGLKWTVFFFVLAAGAWVFAQAGEALMLRLGHWYVESFVIGKSFHHAPPAEYMERVRLLVERVRGRLSFTNPFFWAPFVWAALFLISLFCLKAKKIRWAGFKALFLTVLVIDLFVFGKFHGTGFIGNVGPFPDLSKVERLEKDGRWLDMTRNGQALFPPNRNMLTGHATVGAYSPLLNKDYYLLTKELGALDDSFGRTEAPPDALTRYLPLIDFLGVKYVVVEEEIAGSHFSFLREEDGKKIYKNLHAQSEFTLLSQGIPSDNEKASFVSIDVMETSPLFTELKVDSSNGGTLARSQVYNSGWKVYVDDRLKPLERVKDVFQGVEIPKGGHAVRFQYEPRFFTLGRWFYLMGLLVTAAGILFYGVFPGRGRID